MKNLINTALGLAFALGLTAQPQFVVTDSLGKPPGYILDSLLSQLDLSGLQTGILLDKAVPLVDVKAYDGSSESPALRDHYQWNALYGALHRAQLSGTTVLTDAWVEEAQNLVAAGTIPFRGLHLHYEASLSDPQLLAQLVTFDGAYFRDVPGRSQSPWVQHTAFAASPAVSRIQNSLSQSFIAKPAFFFSNTGLSPAALEIDFGNGQGWQAVTPDQAFTVSWPDYGSYTLSYKITYTDQSVFVSHSKLLLENTGAAPQAGKTEAFDVGYNLLPDLEVPLSSGQGQNLGATLQIEYGCGNQSLRRPFIYVEGFNPDAFGDLDFADLWQALNDYRIGFPANDGFTDIWNNLQQGGYDLVYINFDEGGGDLLENALVLEAAIDWVNQTKAANGSTEPNVVWGESMGGVVARIALREMELAGKAHECSYYVSFDSPHLGANVPYAFQLFLEHVDNIATTLEEDYPDWLTNGIVAEVEQVREALDVLRGPAARQMLIYNIFNDGTRAQFLDYLAGLGMPQQTLKNIGIASGNGNGVGQGFAPLSKMVEIDVNSFTALSQFTNTNDFWSFMAGFAAVVLMGASADVDFDIYALPDFRTNYSKIYYGRIRIYVLYVLPVNLSKREVEINRAQPYDVAPGGRYDLNEFGGAQFQELNDIPGIDINRASFGYIPTVSALNIVDERLNPWYNTQGEAQLVNQAKTNFDEVHFYQPQDYLAAAPAQDNNENHITFTPSNADVMATYLFTDDNGINTLAGGTLHKRTFNFGENRQLDPVRRTTYKIDQDLTVSGDAAASGKICVNCHDKIGFTDVPANPMSGTDVFTLHITNSCSFDLPQLTEVVIEDGGVLELGSSQGKTGHAVVQLNSILRVKAGGKVIVHNQGKLTIEEGGEFILEEGASLELLDKDAALVVRGKLTLGDNATLTFSGNGKLVFDQDIPWVGNGLDFTDFYSFGANTSVVLQGTDKQDVVLECLKPTYFIDESGNKPATFSLTSATAFLHPGALLFSYSATTVNNAMVRGRSTAPDDRHGGLRLWYHSGLNLVKNSTFSNGEYGILAHWNGTPRQLFVDDNLFEYNKQGLRIEGGRFIVQNNTFKKNTDGLYAEGVQGASSLNANVFDDNGNGASLYGSNNTTFEVRENTFLNSFPVWQSAGSMGSGIGLIVDRAGANLNCNTFASNNTGLLVNYGKGFLQQNAYNDFYGNDIGIELNAIGGGDGGLYLQNGNNQFLLSGATSSKLHIQGVFEYEGNFAASLPHSDYVFNATTGLEEMDATGNRFDLRQVASPNGQCCVYEMPVALTVRQTMGPQSQAWPIRLYLPQNLTSVQRNCNSGSSGSGQHPGFDVLNALALPNNGGLLVGSGNSLLNEVYLGLQELSYGSGEGDDLTALGHFQIALTDEITSPDQGTDALLRHTYEWMLSATENSYLFGHLPHTEGEYSLEKPAAMQTSLNIISSRLANLNPQASDYDYWNFKLHLDMVLTLRNGGYYPEALDVLAGAFWVGEIQEQRGGYWTCICETEKDFYDGTIEPEAYALAIQACRIQHLGATYKRANDPGPVSTGYLISDFAEETNLRVYPQPVSDKLSLVLNNGFIGEAEYQLMDVSGKKVESGSLVFDGLGSTLHVHPLPKGVYFLNLKTNDGQVATTKIIKQ